jgi:phosphoribosylformylglycinamidine synthase PurS subunit
MVEFRLQVLVRLREGVLDVQGKTIEQSLRDSPYLPLGSDIRVGKLIELTVTADSEQDALDKAGVLCESLLSNPVIETYEIKKV